MRKERFSERIAFSAMKNDQPPTAHRMAGVRYCAAAIV
jgi:hypothetical protein